jgi:hypothetical protein
MDTFCNLLGTSGIKVLPWKFNDSVLFIVPSYYGFFRTPRRSFGAKIKSWSKRVDAK